MDLRRRRSIGGVLNEIPGFERLPGRVGGGGANYSSNHQVSECWGKDVYISGRRVTAAGPPFTKDHIFGTVLDPSCAIMSGNTDCFTALPSLLHGYQRGQPQWVHLAFACTAVNDIIYCDRRHLLLHLHSHTT